MEEYYRFEQELFEQFLYFQQSSFERFESMLSPTGHPAYSQPFNLMDGPPPQPQHPPPQPQHPAHASQYQLPTGIYVPPHPSWSGPNNQVDRFMHQQEYTVLPGRQAVSPDTVVNLVENWRHEIEDEDECDNEGPKLKRKASAEEVDKLKKAKLDHVGHMNVKTR